MVGVQATNANVHSPGMEPIEKPGSTFPQSSLHQHNFAEAIQVPHCPDQTLWQLSAPDFAEEETHHQSPRQNCQGEPSHMPDNWEPGDHIHLDVVSLMAAGNRHRLTPAPPVAVFDNPAATHDPEGVEFPDTTTEDSEDSDSEDPNWQLSALFATNGQVAQIQVNLVSNILQRHQIARALGWNDAEIVNIHQVARL